MLIICWLTLENQQRCNHIHLLTLVNMVNRGHSMFTENKSLQIIVKDLNLSISSMRRIFQT